MKKWWIFGADLFHGLRRVCHGFIRDVLETNLASRWEGVRLPRASGSPRASPEVPQTSPKFFGDFPGSSLTVERYSNPGVPRKFPRLPRKFPGLPRKFPTLPWRSALSLGSLTPSPDSQKLSLNVNGEKNISLFDDLFHG